MGFIRGLDHRLPPAALLFLGVVLAALSGGHGFVLHGYRLAGEIP